MRGGTDGGVAVNILRGLMNGSTVPHDERWQDRYDNIPRQVRSIEDKLEREREAATAAAGAATAAAAATTATATATAQPIAPGAGAGAPPPPQQPPPPGVGPAPSATPGPTPAVAPIEDALQVFEKWLSLRAERRFTRCSVRSQQMSWTEIRSGSVSLYPVSAKTELINSLTGLPFAVSASTLTVASLLSGTPARQQAQGAKGGLLRQVANPGLLCLKDFTSTLTIRPEVKADVLNALRGSMTATGSGA